MASRLDPHRNPRLLNHALSITHISGASATSACAT
jgi:hypothetical protein